MERKKIIIFGASGNVGSYLALYADKFFNKEEFEVIASGRRETIVFEKEDIKYISVDLSMKDDFSKLPQENIHAVMLLAATIPSYMDEYDPSKYLSSIVDGGLNVLEYCRKVKADRLLFTQTVFDVAEYPADMIIDPYVKPNFSYTGDHAMYVICKNMMLEMMKHYHLEYGLKTFIFRLPTIYSYSPYHYYYPNGVKTMRPFYKQIFRAIISEPLEIWGNPNEAKDMVHVYDFSQMLCRAALVDRQEGFYNIGTGRPVSQLEQCQAIIDVFSPKDNPSKIKYVPTNSAGVGYFKMDITNAKEELGYEPVYDVHKLYENYKEEMAINRFVELRGK
ncbi:MAG: NAD(P)-dependent oxidoreductase [Bacteroidales bacterium]|nr:NAD(P)-dependent oxidoreductase [Bacteroidales bacterium]